MRGKYDDIIHLPHHRSDHHAPMSREDRAGQFSPFAALVGHEAAIRETGRLTQQWVDLDESRKAVLNEKLHLILRTLDQQPRVTITWFRPDERKQGGYYIDTTGPVRKVDPYEHVLLMQDGTRIPVDQIFEIQSPEESPEGF